ncbi:MAG: hypothetical protein KF805_06760 [Phycisphaeraceae bacterium]|nr:hypothetical protein [Phycisphaeraceae bacterium]
MFGHLFSLSVRAMMLGTTLALANEPPTATPELQTVQGSTPRDVAAPSAAKSKDKPAATIPGLSPETFSVPPGRYFPEGTFLVRRTGTVRMLKTGEAIFIPDMPSPRDARRRGERPMILLPCQTLSALQSSVATSPDPHETRVEVSGQLFVYRERQQLLPTIFTVVRSTPTSPESAVKPAVPAKDEEGEFTSVRPGDDPEVADIIKQLESRRSEALPPISSASTEPAKSEAASPMTASDAEIAGASRSLVPEGTLFTDRRGRLVRIGDRLGIAFDGDANTPAEPAMYIIRSKALERLEGSIANRNGTVDIIVTGRVYTYRNQNYILPLMAQIEPPGQLRPLQ